ncbi:MAG: AIPR family protein [Holophagales bacterium]|jgi:hypothetical protein|nr:AIPR family protein [Holophagales bacterium]
MSIYDKISEDIKSDYFQQNYANNGQRFVAWYVHYILGQDRIQTKDAIIDGKNDKQIDAIVIDDDDQIIHILQGKYHKWKSIGESTLVAPAAVSEVFDSWVRLKDLAHLQDVGNTKLQSKLPEVAKALEDDYDVSFELITTAKFSDAAWDKLEIYQSQISEDVDSTATITLVDCDEIKQRLDNALASTYSNIDHTIDLSGGEYMKAVIAKTNVVIATVPMKEAIKIPGIKDGSLFKKNVRQNLGTTNAVNKHIRETIKSDKHNDFFFFHNGITAICNKMELDGSNLKLNELNVVNGCQSLSAMYSCSETIRKNDGDFILFRFYEIRQPERAAEISTNTNTQSAVKKRDLQSNNKLVLRLKKLFEMKYPEGYIITKRGEVAPPDKNKNCVITLPDLGKLLVAWYTQRPNISYGETKIFQDNCFDALFSDKKEEYKNFDHKPEHFHALLLWMKAVQEKWTEENPLDFNEVLFARKSHALYHHLYAVSRIFAFINNAFDNNEFIPLPSAALESAHKSGAVDLLVEIAGRALASAMAFAKTRAANKGERFNAAIWLKNKQCLIDIDEKISSDLNFRKSRKTEYEEFSLPLKLKMTLFVPRRTAAELEK